ncbi:general stress protein 26 [Balneicella halophila]|uniref:General stress protein 26 n=1 Tax=Balneicella halophila TaxID=1537566 RepID=A0A7L4USM8_BALHA|nr:pyridoxamine 5'-phosphate oxidase family protein [Balneicella halophila]PVX52004.1 general stress protein 26 [Balneicella halophila]
MSTKNLYNKEAIDKLKELVEDARFCMMSTILSGQTPLLARPMTVQEVDDEGTLWFFSSKDGDQEYKVNTNSDMQLFFSNTDKQEYLSIYGKATIHTDKETIEKHWSKMADGWFDGKNDPNITVIAIHPEDIKYWETKHGKWMSSALLLYSALTGDDEVNPGISGKLKI